MGVRAISLIGVFFLLIGCDDVAMRPAQTPQPISIQRAAVRVLVPASGIGSLYEASSPFGLELKGAQEVILDEDRVVVKLGPVKQTVALAERSASAGVDEISMFGQLRGITILVPVQIKNGVETEICRYRVRADTLDINAILGLVADEDGTRLETTARPLVSGPETLIFRVGGCALPSQLALEGVLEDKILQYTLDVIADSAEVSFETSPTEALGLLTRRVELARLSPYENRRASITFEGALAADGLKASEDGLEIMLDIGTDARRAGCAPPVDLQMPFAPKTDPISGSRVSGFNADFGMALSTEFLRRIAQTMVVSGFACRGLGDTRKPQENQELIPANDLLLDELGLGDLPIGTWAQIASAPGTLPEVSTRPESGQIQVRWDSLSLEVYAEVRGARVRILELRTMAKANLRPLANTSSVVRMGVESIELESATVSSEWFTTPPDEAAVHAWARRILLLVLANQFVFPIPIEPDVPMKVKGTEVRADDVVLYLSFD